MEMREAVRLDGTSAQAHAALARLHATSPNATAEKLDMALLHYRRSLQLNPQAVDVRAEFTRTLALSGKTLIKDDTDERYGDQLNTVKSHLEHLATDKTHLEHLVTSHPSDVYIIHALASVYGQLKLHKEAVTVLTRALPTVNDVTLLARLYFLLAEHLKDLRQLHEAAKASLRLIILLTNYFDSV